MAPAKPPKVLTSQQVAELMGWTPGYVRKGMRYHGIELVHGWPEDEVRALHASQQATTEENQS